MKEKVSRKDRKKQLYRGNKDKITLAKNVLNIHYVPGMGHRTLYILTLLIPTAIQKQVLLLPTFNS